MTPFVPMASSELRGIRQKRRDGWSVRQCAAHYRRDPEEIDIAMWAMLGRWDLSSMFHCRDTANRHLAKRHARLGLVEMLVAA